MIVEFKRNGRRKNMNAKVARVLEQKGQVRIIGEDPAPVVNVVSAAQDRPSLPATDAQDVNPDGLDQMDREQLLKFAEDLEIKIHGRTGDDRIREIIREHTK